MAFSISSFDFSNGAVLLRLLCGLFFFPHIYMKLVGNPPPVLPFFQAAGFRPAGLWLKVAAVVELVAATALLLGIYTQWAALLAAAILLVAVIALCSANREMKWFWNGFGIEFPTFWALCCVAVAVLHWG